MNIPGVVAIEAGQCRKAEIDYVAEMFSFLGTSRRFQSLDILPPTLGVFALWELTDCQFFRDPWGCEFNELARAVWICCKREQAAPAVERLVYHDDSRLLDEGADLVKRSGGEGLILDLPELITFLHTSPWEGFRMIPPGQEDEPSPFIFDGEKMGSLCAMGAEAELTPFETLWRTPMTRLGHLAAALAKRAGTKGIERPYDEEDIIRLLKAAKDKEDLDG